MKLLAKIYRTITRACPMSLRMASLHLACSLFMLHISIFNSSAQPVLAQAKNAEVQWIRPVNSTAPAIWGIKNGIIVGLWPYAIENTGTPFGGGPRGLLRIGYEYKSRVYMINFLAIEPVVAGKMEFSEISPSQIDNRWGKLIWAGDKETNNSFAPYAITRGVIDYPDPQQPAVERLSFYVFIEKFITGAHPYLQLSIRSDRPEELGIQLFSHEGSAKMDRCAISATMGNYARLRNIYLKEKTIHSKQLYEGYDDIHFAEKQGYPYTEFPIDKNGDFLIAASTDESFEQLAAWPQTNLYEDKWNWRYRPFFKLLQYWRKEKSPIDPSLHLRVNGRTYYWSGGSADKSQYAKIPNGVAFENFELREKFYQGQKFYFGLTRKKLEDMIAK